MSDDDEPKGGLPVTSAGESQKGFHVNLPGLPIPLRRTFGAFDRLLALPIEAAADSLEKKLRGNVDAHVEAVQHKRVRAGKRKRLADPSTETVRAMAEWSVSASEIDPDKERELSAVWRGILDEIMDEREDGSELMRMVQSVPKSDVRFLIEWQNWCTGYSSGPGLPSNVASNLVFKDFKSLLWTGDLRATAVTERLERQGLIGRL
jgi:hypothetical protein